MERYSALREELIKLWDEDRGVKFLEEAAATATEDQMDCLAKMIGYVEEQVEGLDEEMLKAILEGMDTFDGPREFLEYFFKMTNPEVAPSIMAGIDEDPEEIEAVLESMEDQGLIEYLLEMDAFYVWYKAL